MDNRFPESAAKVFVFILELTTTQQNSRLNRTAKTNPGALTNSL